MWKTVEAMKQQNNLITLHDIPYKQLKFFDHESFVTVLNFNLGFYQVVKFLQGHGSTKLPELMQKKSRDIIPYFIDAYSFSQKLCNSTQPWP